jgi:hypothetical protein
MTFRQRLLRLQQPLADARDQERGDDERRGVEPVGAVGAREREQRAAQQRAEHPREVLGSLEEPVRVREILVAHEVRQAGVRRRPEETGREADDSRERDDGERAPGEGKRTEDGRAQEVARDHQLSSRETVEERAEKEPDQDDRDEVRDEQRSDPLAGVRPVPHVDHQREHRETRADAGPDRREEEQPEVTCAAEEIGLAASDHRGHLSNANEGRAATPSPRRVLPRGRARRRGTRSPPGSRR